MASREEQATELKNQGNKAFAGHDWPKAVEFYTKAIELNDQEPAFFTNRAQVCAAQPLLQPLAAESRCTLSTDKVSFCAGPYQDRSIWICHRGL